MTATMLLLQLLSQMVALAAEKSSRVSLTLLLGRKPQRCLILILVQFHSPGQIRTNTVIDRAMEQRGQLVNMLQTNRHLLFW